MSKKNKGGKTPSAKAARNLEALKKAEAALKAQEVKETVETPKEEVKDVPKKEPTPTPAPKKTAYETYLEYKKHPHMSMISQKIEKNDKGVEIITTEWKNTENNETASNSFSASFVKKGDGIDLTKLREQAEKGLKEYYKEKAKPSKEEKKEDKVPEVKTDPESVEKLKAAVKKDVEAQVAKAQKKEPIVKKPVKKEEKAIVPEEVTVEEAPKAKPIAKLPQVTPTGDRIDANHGIELMRSFENRANELEKGTELYRAMREQADIMLFVYGKQWLDQCLLDGDDAIIKVSQPMYNRLAIIGRDLLGLEVKALPSTSSTGEKQMEIDFKETIESAPEETKKALDADAKVKNTTDVPEVNTTASEEEKISALQSILKMKNGMGGNLHNAIQFAQNSFPELKDAHPAQIVATIYQKVGTSTLLLSFKNAMMGNLCTNLNIFSAHTWLKGMLVPYDYDDAQIAAIAKVMLANKLNETENYETSSKSCNKLIKQMNDDLINRILAVKSIEDEKKLIISGKYEGIRVENTPIPAIKLINSLKKAYGADMSNKLLKQQMQKLMGLYADGIKPLDVYVEKSTYVTKK